MKSLTVEYQRFGDSVGILRLSDRYIRTIGTTAPADEVSFPVPQDRLSRAMAFLDYGNFATEGAEARDKAESMLRQLAEHVEHFLCGDGIAAQQAGTVLQIDIVARPLELAQLPFEVVEEARRDLIVTRRIRLTWPPPPVIAGDVPRILFAWAEPGAGMDVPHDRHRKLLDEIMADLGGAIVELPHVTRAKLRATVEKGGFTHVHLLMHGVPSGPRAWEDPLDLDAKPPPSTMLALETETGRIDRCAPEDLACWLELSPRPQVCIVAACHGAEIDPIETGGTIAHTLHATGIPIVLASQLALTKDGSDQLLDVFLRRVIDGQDPRSALRHCRDRLREMQERTYYDRVAVVGYIQVDPDVEERLKERHFRVALERLRGISAEARRRVGEAVEGLASTKEITSEQRQEADAIAARFEKVRAKLADLEPDRTLTKAQREELIGLRASSFKRESEAAWSLAQRLSDASADEWRARSRRALRDARDAYALAAKVSRDHHWTWVQWLVLLAVELGADARCHAFDWAVSEAAASDAARSEPIDESDPKECEDAAKAAIWGQGSLAELILLGPLFGGSRDLDRAKSCLDQLEAGCRARSLQEPIDATLDQLARYRAWWGRDETYKLPRSIVDDAEELRTHLLNRSRA